MAVIRRNKSKESLLRRAHLGDIAQAEEVIELARKNGIETRPLDVEAVMEHLGIEVRYEDLDKETSGYLKNEQNKWVCGVNKKHHVTRQRFTLAHELAHYILHRNDQSKFEDTVLFRKDQQNTMEYEANHFAGALLMPESEFMNVIKNQTSDVEKIADLFGVSPLAARVRAGQLGFTGGAI